jgi:hypothetical protein
LVLGLRAFIQRLTPDRPGASEATETCNDRASDPIWSFDLGPMRHVKSSWRSFKYRIICVMIRLPLS